MSGRKEASRASSATGGHQEDGGSPPEWDNAQASGDLDKSSWGRREGRKPEGKKWRQEEEGRKWKEPVEIMLREVSLFKNLFLMLKGLQEEKQLQ